MTPADSIRTARHRLRLSRPDMAAAIGTTAADLTEYEDGSDVPPAIMASVRALEPNRSAEAYMGRERWVRAVHNLGKYGQGELDVRQMVPEEMVDMMDLATWGPDRRLVETDPARFATLREAALKLYIAGVLVVDSLPEWWTGAVRSVVST